MQRFEDIQTGDTLESLTVPITVALIASGGIATRDYFPGHHDLEAARALLYIAAAKVTANAPDKSRFSAMAKRLSTDSGSEIVNKALQLFGGYGYLRDYPIERFWRDLRVHSILEGTNQVMRMIIGRDLLRQ